ncbi:endophilin-B1-like [Gambusia affinis]|uniref:endophilin-B1-like n=1 Tax=Gambusia affinis TaxID=33528 RepID=UPI001CDD2261|nr:endophilin-B1-like [Gambusia affinis]XP_043998572.1 endophilin-B1-like [Gambusia affinis]
MDLTRLAVDAGQFINRAVQYTGESLGQGDKTELDPGLEELLAQADATKTWTDSIISQTEVLLQPSLGARLEDRLYEHLEWSAPPRPRAHELLGDQMTQAGLEIGSNTPYGTALIRCGEAQKQLGEAERKFAECTNIHFLTPLKSFTEGEYRAIQNERKMLVNKRLDLDIAKTRLRKAHEADREARDLNANPLDDDYLSHVSYMFSFLRVKWLKIWAQEISQAEMELRICQSLFDRQSEVTRQALEGISDTHINHMRSLTDFVDGQASFFAQGNQHAQELQRQMSRIPAVFCSNNWQSAVNNEPLISSHVADEPVGLDQVAVVPKVAGQLPDFDQDSWTLAINPKTETDLSSSDHTNNNNNNNSAISTPGQPSGHQPAVKNQLFTDQTFDLVFTSSQSDELPSPSRTNQGTNSLPSAVRDSTWTFNATFTNGAASFTTAVASPPPQGSTIQNETQTGDQVATDVTASTDVVPDSQIANETHEQPAANGKDVSLGL